MFGDNWIDDGSSCISYLFLFSSFDHLPPKTFQSRLTADLPVIFAVAATAISMSSELRAVTIRQTKLCGANTCRVSRFHSSDGLKLGNKLYKT